MGSSGSALWSFFQVWLRKTKANVNDPGNKELAGKHSRYKKHDGKQRRRKHEQRGTSEHKTGKLKV